MTPILAMALGAALIIFAVVVLYAVAGSHPPPPPTLVRGFTKRGDTLFRPQGWNPRPFVAAPPAPYHRPPDVLPDDGILHPPRPVEGRNGE